MVQKQVPFAKDPKISKLQFSNRWVSTWLRNCVLKRRRVTTSEKILPSPSEVEAQLKEIQHKLVDFDLEETISADETGCNYGAQPKNQYVPKGAERATAPDSDEKARITAMLWGKAQGGMGPPFLIVKCSSKQADLSNTRVLSNLHKVSGLTETDGWKLKMWSRSLSLKEKAKEVSRTFKCPYLIHPTSRAVITIQGKAWMDSPRICMWIDLQLGPHYQKKRGRCALVWDNCGPHGVDAVQKVMEEWGVFPLPLPKNMTDVLQVIPLRVAHDNALKR